MYYASPLLDEEMEADESQEKNPRLERMNSRRVEYWGVPNEFYIYSRLLAPNVSSAMLEDYENSIFKLFKRRIMSRLRVDLDEVIQFRINFDFERFGSRENKHKFQEIVDSIVCSRLIDANSSFDLKQLCESLKEKKSGNQKLLFYYVNKLLNAKWPKRTEDPTNESQNETQYKIAELEYALRWNSFLVLEEIHLEHVANNLCVPLDSATFENVFKNFSEIMGNIANGSATFQIIKVIHANLNEANKFGQFLLSKNLPLAFCFNASNMNMFEILVKIRMKECKEFELYRANLKAFVQFCNNFKQINVKAYAKQLNELEKRHQFDMEAKLSSVCNVLSFEHDILSSKFRDVADITPKIIFFLNINVANMPVITELINLNRACCTIFDSYFSEICNNKIQELHSSKPKELYIEHVIDQIWPLTRIEWKKITNVIQNGTIKLVELDGMLKKYFGNNYAKMQAELIYMNKYFKINRLDLRNDQIK